MVKRTVTALLLLAFGMPALAFGGVLFYLLVGFFLVVAAWEFVQLFRAVALRPSIAIMTVGTAAILTARAFFQDFAQPVLVILVFLAMFFHMLEYERGRDKAAIDFSITLAGLLYIGWVGAYLYDLRALPNGGWWLMLVLPSVWLADSGAYAIGAAYGKHKWAPRLSPKKSWEGYIAGIFTGAIGGAFFVYAYTTWGNLTDITIFEGALLGLVLSTVAPLGDLGESMLKRQAGIKDSGNLIPGHGGAFDRIDTWLWAAPIGFYLIHWLWI